MKIIVIYFILLWPLLSDAQTAFIVRKAQLSPPDSILVNIYDGGTTTGRMNQPNWNNWVPANLLFGQTTTSSVFTDVHGTATAVTATFSGGPETDLQSFFTDNGAGWASATTSNYPDTVWELPYLFTTGGETSASDTLILNNLPTPSTGGFTIELISSRNTVTPRPQTFTIGVTTFPLDAQNNINSVLSWTSVSKDGNNQIKIIMHYTNTFGFFNAFKIKWTP